MCAEPTAKKQKLARPVPEMPAAELDRKLWSGASAAGWTGKLYGEARHAHYFSPRNSANGERRQFTSAKEARERRSEFE